MINTETINWLLEAETASIRMFTLRDVLHKSSDDPEVVTVRQAMASSGPIPAILSRQTDAGNWADEYSYYTPKYQSTHWSMLLLTELGIDPNNPQLQRGIEFMLEMSMESIHRRLAHTDQQDRGLLCFWGNVLRYALHGGRVDDPRIQPILDYIEQEAAQTKWQCVHSQYVPCAWGVVRALWGLAAIPADSHTPEIQQTIETGL